MLQVFRIEHAQTQLGPFQTPGEYTQDLAVRAGRRRRLRNPEDDGLAIWSLPYGYRFACPSLDILKGWFFLGSSAQENDAIVARLAELGFVLAEFLVEDTEVRRGYSGVQLAFDAESCREEGLVEFRDLNELQQNSPYVFCVN